MCFGRGLPGVCHVAPGSHCGSYLLLLLGWASWSPYLEGNKLRCLWQEQVAFALTGAGREVCLEAEVA